MQYIEHQEAFKPAPSERRRWIKTAAALGLVGAWPWCSRVAHAAPVPAPKDKVVLSVVGLIGTTNAPQRLDLDMAMLAALPQHSFVTQTPWYDKPRKFTGPLLRDVLSLAKAKGKLLRAVALNDYKIDIPAEDATLFDVVVARLLDDEPMPVRAKGPLFIIYPFDLVPVLRSNHYYARAAWQLRTLEVL